MNFFQVWSAVHSVRGQTKVETGRWNPHRNYHQFATVCGSQVVAWDTRTSDQCWTLHNSVSSQSIRTVDFNPNKQYYMVTGCDDGCVSVWDTRNSGEVLLSSRQHSHWVWSTRSYISKMSRMFYMIGHMAQIHHKGFAREFG